MVLQTFCEISVNEGQIVCVELVAKNPFLKDPRVLFLGSIKYEALKRVYDIRVRIIKMNKRIYINKKIF